MARAALLLALGARTVSSKCLSSDALEHEFLGITGLDAMPSEGSCCQFDVCGLPCAAPHDPKNPPKFYGRSVAMAIAAFCAIGLVASYYVGDDTNKFFVAGRTLPLPIVVMTLASQCIDANAVLGNADLSYWYHFYDGAVLPIGLGLSLILNGLFLAKPINEMKLLTLPDLYARKYGRLTEVLGSLICTASFIALLAGNLVGCGKIMAYLFPVVPLKAGITLSGLVMLLYTAAGGLVSVAYSDCAQALFGLLGVAVCALWAAHHGNKAPPDSFWPVWKSNFGRSTPSTRGRLRSCICSTAWSFYAIDATLSP
jgi:Na+/proline symporter